MSVRLQRLLLGIAFAVIANEQREVRLPPWFRAKECGHNHRRCEILRC